MNSFIDACSPLLVARPSLASQLRFSESWEGRGETQQREKNIRGLKTQSVVRLSQQPCNVAMPVCADKVLYYSRVSPTGEAANTLDFRKKTYSANSILTVP